MGDQLPLPRSYSATGRAHRRKWRYIQNTHLYLLLPLNYSAEVSGQFGTSASAFTTVSDVSTVLSFTSTLQLFATANHRSHSGTQHGLRST